MIRFRPKRRQLVTAVGAALALHLAMGGFLALWRPSIRSGTSEALSDRGAYPEPDSAADAAEPAPPIDRNEVRSKIDASLGVFSGQDQEQLAKHVEKAANWLETRSSEAAIDGIGDVVRDSCAAPIRAYAPVDPPPAGGFDYNSMLPYAVRHTTGEDGSTLVIYTWVDQEGRSKDVETPLDASDPALTTGLQMAQRSSMMRRLFETSVLPVLESQLRPQR